MHVSTRGRYALRMLLDIAKEQGACVSLGEIAERQQISRKYLEQIAQQLTQGGVLTALRGHQGGYRLAAAPSEYTVLRILELMEGSLAPVSCLDDSAAGGCERQAGCLTLPLWQGLDQTVRTYLGGITLQDVLDGRVGPLGLNTENGGAP